VTSSDICAVLRDRYKQPEWSLFFEVANGTGSNTRRHADAVAMNMYPSRGLSILGFEIKVSRQDLKRELENPDKAEEVAKYCDEWWLAVPKGLIKEDDNIPVPWGIMECENSKFSILKKAQKLEAKPVTKQFMAAVVRSAGKVDQQTINDIKNAEWRRLDSVVKQMVDTEVEHRTRRYDNITKNLEEFEQATGQKIGYYTDIPGLAEKIKLAEEYQNLSGMIEGKYGRIATIRRQMEEFLNVTEQLKVVEQ